MNSFISYRNLKVALTGSLFLFLFSCSFLDSKRVCKIGNSVLYEDELTLIQEAVFSHLPKEDSRSLAIERWATQERVKLEMEEHNSKILKDNKLQIEEDLLQLNMFELENFYLTSHLDSLISEDDIQDYYNQNRDEYKTESYIVRALYVEIPDTVPEIAKIEKHYLLKNDKDREEVEKIGNLYATNFYFEEKVWIYSDDLLRGAPISSEDKAKLIKSKGNMVVSYGGEVYYINILDSKIKSVSSPLESERDRIRNDILKRRINKLREKAKEIILKDVKEKYPVTYF